MQSFRTLPQSGLAFRRHLSRAGLIVLIPLLVNACGGGSGGGSSTTKAPENPSVQSEWDEMKWDQGEWQ